MKTLLDSFGARAAIAVLLAAVVLVVCFCVSTRPQPLAPATPAVSAASQSFYSNNFEKTPSAADMTALGRKIFLDATLSASGKMSCASCHDPAHAFGPPDGLAVRLAGPDLQRPGVRAVPSLRYLQSVPAFTQHMIEDEGTHPGEDQGPAGGHTWDGRASSVHEQARLPLFSEFEMANTSEASVVAKVEQGAYAADFRSTYGDHVFEKQDLAFKGVLMALEVFQQSPQDFYPYSSKFDAVLRKKATLTEQEARGLAAFNDPNKGNCASCHVSSIVNGNFPAFTDFGMLAIGVPRNTQIPANQDPAYFDLGVCGPLRTDLKDHPELCGLFRTPSLRNVTTRKVFMHNGEFHDLRKVIEFYAQRDIHPEKFYPKKKDGSVDKFNDLPEQYRENLNTDGPFDRKPGDKPALSDAEITDMLAFFKTLEDGYTPPAK